MNKLESHTYIEKFINPYDAFHFLEGHMMGYPEDVWEIIEYRIVKLGGIYSAGITFMKRQLEMDLED